MKGVILAGGNGTRLKPMTLVTNKHLLPVFDKPMIMYPLETLRSMGVTDILIVSGGEHIGDFMELLQDGSWLGFNLTYKIQKEAGGIAQALLLAEDFVPFGEQFVVVLGDNIFEYPPKIPPRNGIVLKTVDNPQRFGVYNHGRIEEKPKRPPSNMAVTGLYFYTPKVFHFIKQLSPSKRGELEITDVNNMCLQGVGEEECNIQVFDGFWTDAGTPESLLAASNFYGKKK